MAYTPKSRIEFWNSKFHDNIQRFQVVKKNLKKLGWKVFVIWECQTKDDLKLMRNIEKISNKMLV